MTKHVRPRMSFESEIWMKASLSASRLLLASSRMRIAGSERMAREIAMLKNLKIRQREEVVFVEIIPKVNPS